MTVGRRHYNEAEMLQMQRDAESRVREMQNRARKTVEEANMNGGFTPPPRNRNWNAGPGMSRQRGQQRRSQTSERQKSHQGEKPLPELEVEAVPVPDLPETEPAPEAAPEAPADRSAEPKKDAPQKKGTIVGDIMDALGLDEDYLLIIGLLLILINQRADTTLILALVYLLF